MYNSKNEHLLSLGEQVALEFDDFQFGIGNAEDFKDLLDDSLGGKPGRVPKILNLIILT